MHLINKGYIFCGLCFFISSVQCLNIEDNEEYSFDTKVKYQEEVKNKFSFKFSGSVNLETFYDSRQVEGNFQDEYVKYALPVQNDPRNLDINNKDQLNMIGFRTYARADVKGPEVWRARTSSVVEGKFTGVSDDTVRLFRLQKAYVQFDWDKTTMRIGHDYHPIGRCRLMSGDEFYPYTVSAGYGKFYDPFTYAAQIRLQHRFRNFELMYALTKHYESFAARLAIRPDFFIQLTAKMGRNLFGVGMDYHTEVPRIVTNEYFKTTEELSSVHPFLLVVIEGGDHFKFYSRLFYSENGRSFDILGAYAVRCIDKYTDERGLVNLRAVGFWADAVYEGKKYEPAVFVGMTKNIGAACDIQKSYTIKKQVNEQDVEVEIPLLKVYGALTNVDYMFIVAPRLRLFWGPMEVGAEIEYTRVAYACRGFDEKDWQKDFDSRGRVIHTRPVSNTRLLVATRYYF